MAGGKASPRQKMINMMYLVLTALLALNVSKEVLDAFVKVNISLNQQNQVLVSKNNATYSELANQLQLNPGDVKYKNAFDKATLLDGYVKEIIAFFDKLKVDLLVEVEAVDETRARELLADPFEVNKKDDYDMPTHFFGTSEPPGDKGRANEVKNKLQELKDRILALVDNNVSIVDKLAIMNLSDPDPNSKTAQVFRLTTWELQYFYHLPLSAALLEIAKWENIVRGAEADVLTFLWDQISAGAFKFDAVEARVIPKSTFVTAGGNFEADVFLAAFNSTVKPTIIYGTSVVDSASGQVANSAILDTNLILNGIGKISIPASGTGERSFAGLIKMLKPGSDEVIHYPFSTSYTVSPPMAAVAPTQMNVFYMGLDNPISVSAPGFSPSQLVVTGTGPISISGSNGNYIVKATATGTAKVNVSAKTEDGKTISMGSQDFRVKRVPDPVVKWGGKKNGEGIAPGLAANSPLIPEIENFEFNVFASIRSFKVAYFVNGIMNEKEVQGNVLPREVSDAIKNMRRGSKVYFDNVKVSLPGGDQRTLASTFTIM
jgi:gliding motility-associated protein GldM